MLQTKATAVGASASPSETVFVSSHCPEIGGQFFRFLYIEDVEKQPDELTYLPLAATMMLFLLSKRASLTYKEKQCHVGGEPCKPPTSLTLVGRN